MNHYLLFIATIVTLMFSSSAVKTKAQDADFAKYVDPFIGTGFHGHVFLGANVPFGAVQAGPVNFIKGWDWCSGYHYSDSIVTGFSQTHLSGTGVGDFSCFRASSHRYKSGRGNWMEQSGRNISGESGFRYLHGISILNRLGKRSTFVFCH